MNGSDPCILSTIWISFMSSSKTSQECTLPGFLQEEFICRVEHRERSPVPEHFRLVKGRTGHDSTVYVNICRFLTAAMVEHHRASAVFQKDILA